MKGEEKSERKIRLMEEQISRSRLNHNYMCVWGEERKRCCVGMIWGEKRRREKMKPPGMKKSSEKRRRHRRREREKTTTRLRKKAKKEKELSDIFNVML